MLCCETDNMYEGILLESGEPSENQAIDDHDVVFEDEDMELDEDLDTLGADYASERELLGLSWYPEVWDSILYPPHTSLKDCDQGFYRRIVNFMFSQPNEQH